MGVRYSSCQILWRVLDKKNTQMFNFIQPGFYPIFQCKHKDCFIGIWRSTLHTVLNPQLLCIITHDHILNLCLECWAYGGCNNNLPTGMLPREPNSVFKIFKHKKEKSQRTGVNDILSPQCSEWSNQVQVPVTTREMKLEICRPVQALEFYLIFTQSLL